MHVSRHLHRKPDFLGGWTGVDRGWVPASAQGASRCRMKACFHSRPGCESAHAWSEPQATSASASGRRSGPEIRRGSRVSRRVARIWACCNPCLIFAIKGSTAFSKSSTRRSLWIDDGNTRQCLSRNGVKDGTVAPLLQALHESAGSEVREVRIAVLTAVVSVAGSDATILAKAIPLARCRTATPAGSAASAPRPGTACRLHQSSHAKCSVKASRPASARSTPQRTHPPPARST